MVSITNHRTLLCGHIEVVIEGIGSNDVMIHDKPTYVYIIVSHVYNNLTGQLKSASWFLNHTKIVEYRQDPQYLKVELI